MKMWRDRRKFVRLNSAFDVVYARRKLAPAEKLALSKNISAGGICLILYSAYDDVKKGDILDLTMHLPNQKKAVGAIGKVVWVRRFEIKDKVKGSRFEAGIEFVAIENKDRENVRKFVFAYF
ncbi:MAG: PilZ domain-containing protein [Candidatus Omnitrophota bacterium]